MQVENVYQDAEGKWHVDYSFSHLMGLALRVYLGQILITLVIFVPLMILLVAIGVAFGKSLPEGESSYQESTKNESVCPVNKLKEI